MYKIKGNVFRFWNKIMYAHLRFKKRKQNDNPTLKNAGQMFDTNNGEINPFGSNHHSLKQHISF